MSIRCLLSSCLADQAQIVESSMSLSQVFKYYAPLVHTFPTSSIHIERYVSSSHIKAYQGNDFSGLMCNVCTPAVADCGVLIHRSRQSNVEHG